MILIAFFKADPEPYLTNEERQEWAAWYLRHNRFLYKHANGPFGM